MRGWPLRAGFLPAGARLHWQPTCHAAPPHRAVLRRAALASASGHFSAAFCGFTFVLEFVFVADLLLVVLKFVFVTGLGALGGARVCLRRGLAGGAEACGNEARRWCRLGGFVGVFYLLFVDWALLHVN